MVVDGPRVGVRRLRPDAALPVYATVGAAGLDLSAAIDAVVFMLPGERRLIGAGVAVELPGGYEAQVRPRSGLALKHGVTVLNSPGTIDADYRGEVKVLLVNLGQTAFAVSPGDRIAQLVIAPVTRVSIVEVEALSGTARAAGGFGHTGTRASEP